MADDRDSFHPLGAVIDLVVAAAVGLVAGRVARWAADADGRRRARHPISGRADGPGRAPLEAITVALVVLLVVAFGRSWELAPAVVVVTASVATGVTDLRSHRIPDRIVGPSLVSCAIAMVTVATILGEPRQLWLAACGAATFGAILLGVHLSTPAGLGRGDVKFGVLLGAAIGWLHPTVLATVEAVVWSLLAASVLGLVSAVVAHRFGRHTDAVPLRRRRVAFGPAMSIATLGVVVAAETALR